MEVIEKHPHPDTLSSLQSLLVTVVIAVFVITFIVQAFQIPSESMENTLLTGDYLLVDKLHFGRDSLWDKVMPYAKVHRGDIVVFHYPVHPSDHFVKRVVAVPGDRLRLVNRRVYVNGVLVPEPYVHYSRPHDTFRDEFPKLDMPEGMIRQFATPPSSPRDCVFALTTQTLSADLKTKIVPCQFGGDPDCSSCGCVASMGLAAVAAHRLAGIIPVGAIFKASIKIGQVRSKRQPPVIDEPLRVLG